MTTLLQAQYKFLTELKKLPRVEGAFFCSSLSELVVRIRNDRKDE